MIGRLLLTVVFCIELVIDYGSTRGLTSASAIPFFVLFLVCLTTNKSAARPRGVDSHRGENGGRSTAVVELC